MKVRLRTRWKTFVGVLSIPKRIALAAVYSWSSKNRRKRDSHGWEVVPRPPSPSSSNVLFTSPPLASPSLAARVISSDVKVDSKFAAPHRINRTLNNSGEPVANFDRDFEAHPPSKVRVSLDKPIETDKKRLTLGEIPFSVITQCAPSELPEDLERLIFEMAAREDHQAALRTLVFVNHRIRKWVEYIIYESVILRDAKHARLFLGGLELKHPDFGAGAVKILALPNRISFDTSLKILSICKDVRHLSWLPVNPVSPEIVDLVANLPLVSLRARISSFVGNNPDFSAPLFRGITTLFVADHQDAWKTWKWHGLRKTRPKLKWLSFNLDGKLQTTAGWAPVRTLEKMVLGPYGGETGIRLCVCYSYNSGVSEDRWIHRSEDTFLEERMAVLSLKNRIDEKEWEKRVNGERRDFEISEELVRERQTEERRLRFQCKYFIYILHLLHHRWRGFNFKFR